MDVLATLTRTRHLADRTLGQLHVYRGAELVLKLMTLELPWVDEDDDGVSDRRVSRIPAGVYTVTPWNSVRFPGTYRLSDPEGRSHILIHAGNYPKDTLGCILVGLDHRDLDRDGRPDLARSRAALLALRDAVGHMDWRLAVTDDDIQPEDTPALRDILRLLAPMPPAVVEPRAPDIPEGPVI